MKENQPQRHRDTEMEEYAADKRGFSRIRNMRFRRVCIRVHPWLILAFSL